MFTKKLKSHNYSMTALTRASAVALFTVAFVVAGNAQTEVRNAANTATAQNDPTAAVAKQSLPVLTDYKGVKIGSTADEVREKLGKAKIDDDDGFYYRFNDGEFAQIRLDNNKKVRLISITYSGDNNNTPAYADIFGEDVTMTAAKPDGSVYKLVRYPQAGYWVAYSRTAGNDPSVTVTMQKIRALK